MMYSKTTTILALSHLDLSLPSLRLADALNLEASAKGTIDAAFLNPLLDSPGVRVAGLADLELSVLREAGTFELNGQGTLRDGRLVRQKSR